MKRALDIVCHSKPNTIRVPSSVSTPFLIIGLDYVVRVRRFHLRTFLRGDGVDSFRSRHEDHIGYYKKKDGTVRR